jgi:hypothetical protein
MSGDIGSHVLQYDLMRNENLAREMTNQDNRNIGLE